MKENLKNTVGWMNCKKKSKGFTLIEIVIVMGITIAISGAIISLIIESLHNYDEALNKSLRLSTLDNAMINIDILCNSPLIIEHEANSIEYKTRFGENILISYWESYSGGIINEKLVYLSGEELKVRTYRIINGNKEERTTNVLLKDVSEFKVIIKDKLIYYKIKTKYGGKRVRCI